MAGRRVVIEFLGKDTSLSKTANQAESRTSQMGAKLTKVGKAAAAGLAVAGLGAIVVGKQIIGAASDAQQSLGATETVFGKFSDKVKMYSEGAANSVGLSANAYRENANLIGSLFKNQGIATDQLAGKTHEMVKLGADLAATFGGTTKDSVEALGSAFKGEFDPLERYGISLKQSTVNAEAMRVAHVKSQSAFDKLSVAQQTAAKQQATSNLIMKQSKDSAGAFAKESDTLAGAQQRLGAKFENLKATLGEKLLPIATKVVSWVSEMIDKFRYGGQAGDTFKRIFSEIGDVVKVVVHWIGSELVPTVKDLAKRFMDAIGGTDGLKKMMKQLEPTVRLVKAVIGALWVSLKEAAKVAIPMVVASLKLTVKTIGALSQAAIWLWNKAFQPTIRFIVKGIGWLMDKIGDLLGALSHIPGFGWAKDAADKMHDAAKKAKTLADNINDIPSKKEIKIKVKYSSNNGPGSADVQPGYSTPKKGHARGTPSAPAGWAWTGEQGPELIKFRGGERVVPHGKSMAMAGAGGGVTINFNGLVTDPQGTAREVRRILLELQRTTGRPLGLA